MWPGRGASDGRTVWRQIFSPKASATGRRPGATAGRRAEVKPPGCGAATVLFLSAFLFLFPAFGDGPREMLLGLAAGGLLILSAWLTREGLRAEAAYNARKVARRPAFPRKAGGRGPDRGRAWPWRGDCRSGAGLSRAFTRWSGPALHLGAFGLDPMSDKGMEGIDSLPDRPRRPCGRRGRKASGRDEGRDPARQGPPA